MTSMLAAAGPAMPLAVVLPIVAMLALVAVTAVVVAATALQGSIHVAIGERQPPLGIALRADPLAATFLAMTNVVGAGIALYALVAFRHRAEQEERAPYSFWVLFLFLWAGLNGVFLSNDLFNLYVLLEVVGLSAVAMVAFEGGAVALRAQLRYLLLATAGSLFYLFGVALLYAEHGVLDLGLVAAAIDASPPATAAAALMTLGLLIKGAIWPLHFWLPQAHASAPPPVSAALSALVVKAPLFLLIRLWFEVFPSVLPLAAWTLLGVLGAAAVLWGSMLALVQQRLKLMIAYSTVAQLGYMLFLFPLAIRGGAVAEHAWSGALLQIISHGFAKAGMFLAAGALILAIGSDERARLAGAARCAPVPVFAFALAGLSIIALPPSGGFLAKWLLLWAAITAGAWWLAVVLVVGGLLAAGYLFRFLAPTLERLPENKDISVPTGWRGTSAMLLALISVALGLAAEPVTRFFGNRPSWFETGLP